MRQTRRICAGVIAATLGLAVAAAHPPPAAEPTSRSSNDASRLRETIDRLNQHVAREAPAARAVGSARIGLAYALLGRHRFREALAEAREVAHRRPQDPEVLALLGDIHFGLGNYAEAEAFFLRLADLQLTLHSLARVALIQQHRGRLSEAAATLAEALEAGRLLGNAPPDLAWCHTMIGELELGRGNIEEAGRSFQSALDRHERAHAAAWRLAQVDLMRKEPARAKAGLLALVEAHPKPAYWITLGEACDALGEIAEARRWYVMAESDMLGDLARGDVGHVRELVELWLAHPLTPDPSPNAARAVQLALGDLEEIRQDVGAFETAAWALHCAGEHEEALRLIRRALRRSADARTPWRAAMIHDAVGRGAEACLLFDRARERNPMIDAFMAPVIRTARH